MSTILCFAEHQNGRLTDATLEIIGAGRTLADKAAGELTAALFGAQTRPLIDTLGAHGADRVLLCEEARLDGYAPEAAVFALAEIVSQEAPLAVLFAATSLGADLSVRLAARLRSAFVPRCTSLAFDAERRLKVTR